jgi:membrane protein YdbS with pleckstrin-like domain
MRIRIERGEGKTWFLSVSGESNRPVTRRSLIWQTIMMVMLDIVAIVLTITTAFRAITDPHSSPVIAIFTAICAIASVGVAHYPRWRRVYRAVIQNLRRINGGNP